MIGQYSEIYPHLHLAVDIKLQRYSVSFKKITQVCFTIFKGYGYCYQLVNVCLLLDVGSPWQIFFSLDVYKTEIQSKKE